MKAQSKSEFSENFKKQVLKLNQFLQTWSKELKANAEESTEAKLLKLVVEFCP